MGMIIESPNNNSRTSFYAEDALEILELPSFSHGAKRFSLQKRKPPPKLDLDEDPFASVPLSEIRPSRRYTVSAHHVESSLPPISTPALLDLDMHSTPISKHFTLSVSPPTYPIELPEYPFQSPIIAAQQLTSPSMTSLIAESKDEHRLESYSALCSGRRSAIGSRPLPVPPISTPTNMKERKRHSHYMTRRQTAFQATAQSSVPSYTPPLTPDLSGSSSISIGGFSSGSSALLLNNSSTPSLHMTPEGANIMELPPSPSPTTSTFMRKLMSRKSTGSLSRNLAKHLTQSALQHKELPPLPHLPLPSNSSIGAAASPPSLPRVSALMAGSNLKLEIAPPPPSSGGSKYSQRTSPTLVNIDAQYSPVISPLALEPIEDTDFNPAPQKQRSRFLSFNSKSLLRSKVDLFEANGGRKPYGEVFDEWALPTPEQLHMAGSMLVVSESGVRVRFGDLWRNGKTVVIFIRHFRSAPCQDYIRSISEELDVAALQKAGLQFVVVGLGSHHMIAPYRHLTGTNFAMYTDPTLCIHRILGMNLKSLDSGSTAQQGHYVKSGLFGGLGRTLKDAITLKLPMFENGGDMSQLGGEFILGPNQRCYYAHRMKTTRSHAPILNVVGASGIQRSTDLSANRAKRLSQNSATADEEAWMTRRRRSLLRIQKKRQSRRLGGELLTKSMDELVVVGGKMRVSVIEEGVEADDREETRTLTDVR